MNRRTNVETTEKFVLPYDHAQVTATTAVKLFKADRPMRITRCHYVNPTGLTNDAANYYDIQVKTAALVAANWSTETGQEGAIAADTFVELTLGVSDNLVLAKDAELSLNLAETGIQTLPAGRVVIEGVYL